MSRQRDGYKRIVVYQPRRVACVDIGPSHMLAPRFSSGEDYFASSAGTNRAVSRTRSIEIPIVDRSTIEVLRSMHQEGCEMRMIAFGHDSHLVWDLDSEINLVSFRGGPRSFLGERLIFNTDVFWGSIYQSERLFDGFPWYCQDATLDTSDNNYYLPGPTGYQGTRWQCGGGSPSTVSVDKDGVMSGTLVLTMIFPMQTAELTLHPAWVGTFKTLDFSGNTLTSTAKALNDTEVVTIDDKTWKIELTVTVSTGPPYITVTDVGDIESVRRGECVDCSDLSAEVSAVTAPSWTS